jgi:hypothetical protein
MANTVSWPGYAQKLSRTLSRICPEISGHLSRICPEFVQKLSRNCPEICPEIVHKLSRICPEFVQTYFMLNFFDSWTCWTVAICYMARGCPTPNPKSVVSLSRLCQSSWAKKQQRPPPRLHPSLGRHLDIIPNMHNIVSPLVRGRSIYIYICA